MHKDGGPIDERAAVGGQLDRDPIPEADDRVRHRAEALVEIRHLARCTFNRSVCGWTRLPLPPQGGEVTEDAGVGRVIKINVHSLASSKNGLVTDVPRGCRTRD